MTGRAWDLILAGGGLANGLIAWRLRQLRPELKVLLLEAESQAGGNHTWSFHQGDLTPEQHRWIAPLVSHRWQGYDVRFPGLTRSLDSGYYSITSDHFAEALTAALGDDVQTGARVHSLTPDSVNLEDGRSLTAGAVIDGRGYRPDGNLTTGSQSFLGQLWRLHQPHGLTRPILMDATVDQNGGYRFVYTLPFSATELLIEDTHYVDVARLDPDRARENIRQYASKQGWQLERLLREEQGDLPIMLAGDVQGFWQQRRGQPCSGLRAGLFHATTGYSLPHAVRLADAIAALPTITAAGLHSLIHGYALRQWRAQRFFRVLNRMLFLAGEPDRRWQVMQRFYTLNDGLIARFYAGQLTLADKARILAGKPPVPVGEALLAILQLTPGYEHSTMNKTVIIGAGFGGLALAIRLQAQGIATLLLEQRDKPGGRAYVYQDKGFTFDAGPTVITDPTAIEELFTLAGRRMADYVDLLPVTPFYRLCWETGEVFDYDNVQDRLEEQIRRFNPRDVEGYRRFHAYSRAVFKEGYLKLGTVPFLSFRDMLRAGPQLTRLQAWRSVYGMVSRFIENEQLRQAFSFHSLLVGGNPFATSSIYTLIHALEREWGVWFARGGTGALVQGLVKLYQDLGGELRLNAEVTSLETEGSHIRAVELKGGERIPVAAVASNADVVHTYEKLLGHHPVGAARAASLKRKRMSNSLFVLYFGLNKQHDLAHHTVCFGPRYKELIDEIFNKNALAEDFSLYLHAPCVTDPSLAPPGCGSYYVLAPVPHLGVADLDWATEGPRLRDRIFAYLEEHYMPGLRSQLVTHRIFTPFDFRDELGAHQGSAFSIEPILRQSAWFRPHNRDSRIPNLYLVGAGTHPGAGIPGVIGSAKATAGLMLEALTG